MGIDKNQIPSTKFVPTDAFSATTATAARKASEAKDAKHLMVPYGNVHVLEDFNVRIRDTADNRAHIDNLKRLIRANGFDDAHPIPGFPGKVGDADVILARGGHSRMQAVNEINAEDIEAGNEPSIPMVPVVLGEAASTPAAAVISLANDNTGKPFTTFEKALLVKRLLNYGMAEAEIATELNMTPRYVEDLKVLVAAPKTVRDFVIEDRVSATEAIKRLRADPDSAGKVLIEMVANAEAKGKKSASAKDAGPRMKTVKSTVNVTKGNAQDGIVKLMTADLLATLTMDGGMAATDAVIEITIRVPEPPKAPATPKAAAAPKKAAAKGAKAAAKAPAAAKPKAAAKPAAKAPAAKKPAAKKPTPATVDPDLEAAAAAAAPAADAAAIEAAAADL